MKITDLSILCKWKNVNKIGSVSNTYSPHCTCENVNNYKGGYI